MEEKNKIFVMEKKNLIWVIVSVVLAVAAVGAVVFAVCHKLNRKKKALKNAEEAPALDAASEEAEDGIESEPFEVPAEAVISGVDNMDVEEA